MSERKPTRKESRKAEAAAHLARVRAALGEAHQAAADASAAFMRSAKRTPEGFIADLCGGAAVVVYRPSYRLREGLKALNEVQRDYNGAWHISNFSKHVGRTQSVTAHAIACEAACDVLRQRLHGEGEFFSKSYVN